LGKTKLYYNFFAKIIKDTRNSGTIEIVEFYTDSNNYIEYSIFSSTSGLIFLRNNNSNFGIATISKSGYYFIEVFYDGAQLTNATKLVIYINRVKQTLTFSGTIPSILPTGLSVGGIQIRSNTSVTNNTGLVEFSVYSTFPSFKESDELYIKNINRRPLNPPIVFQPNLSILKPTEVKETGILLVNSCKLTSGKLINIAWNSPSNSNNSRQFDRTTTKVKNLKDSVQLNTSSTTQSINLGNIQTLQYVIKPTVLNQTLAKLNSSSNVSITSGGGIDITGVSTETVYINGSTTGVISTNTWNTITITLSSALNANDYILGNLSYSGYINDEKVYNRILTNTEIRNYHNHFVSKIVLKEDFKQYTVGNTRIGNWQVKSGGFVISEDSQGKYLKCTSNGVIQLSLVDSDKLNTKSYIGTMTLSKTSLLTKLTATTNQICRLIELTQGVEVL